jgi:DNA-binding MarR family transcriptional regulator
MCALMPAPRLSPFGGERKQDPEPTHRFSQFLLFSLSFLDTYRDNYYCDRVIQEDVPVSEEDLFSRRPMGMRMAMVVRQWRAIIDDAILETGLTQSSWTVMMQLQQLGDNVSVSELAEVQGIELPPLMRTLSQLEKQGYLLRTTSPYDKRIRLLRLTSEGNAVLETLTQVIETFQARVSHNIAPEHMDIFSATLNQIACNLRTIREEDNKTQK